MQPDWLFPVIVGALGSTVGFGLGFLTRAMISWRRYRNAQAAFGSGPELNPAWRLRAPTERQAEAAYSSSPSSSFGAMPALVPDIHILRPENKARRSGSSPTMTTEMVQGDRAAL